ncbi:TAT-variant-translocated molybdopterin oxidoreductase [Lignipirellula cremea]|nr:TAT-variant-translocated molybdopterin oxidoreductase [Lignipirellula cremea]
MSSQPGRSYWRSLEELAGSDDFQQYLRENFPPSPPPLDGTSRREFLSLIGASLALAGLTGCSRQPPEKIVPYVRQPELIVPGKSLYFATAMTQGGVATGLLVESQMGRPTKIEGNPRHPSVPAIYWKGDDQTAPGVSDTFAQASLLTLYDPDRSQTVINAGEISTWDAFLTALRPALESQQSSGGKGLQILSETISSPTLLAQKEALLELFPEAKWRQYEPVNRDQEQAGAMLAFGSDAAVHYDLEPADVILALDADFLITGPDHLRHAQAFARRRDVNTESVASTTMNRLYALESTPTLTGAKADHRLPLLPEQIEQFTLALAERLGVKLPELASPPNAGALPETAQKWLEAIAADLQNGQRPAGRASLILAGPSVSPQSHALIHAMNAQLGNVGKTVRYTEPLLPNAAPQQESLRELVADLQAGQVKLLCILGGNPVYSSPADLDFAAAMEQAPFRVRLGVYEDETSVRCHWHLPEAHFLETWSDARGADGTASIVQPLIAPLYRGRSVHELLGTLTEQPGRSSYDHVKAYWKSQFEENPGLGISFEDFWQTALHEGVIPDTALPEKTVALDLAAHYQEAAGTGQGSENTDGRANQVTVVFRPDPTVYDGRYANNGWLQECPKPFSKLTWDNAAYLSPAMAERLQLKSRDLVELSHDGKKLKAPVWVLPGHPDHSVTLHWGYGRSRAGRVGNGAGFNAYALQNSLSPWRQAGVTIRATGEQFPLSATQHHHLMEGRDIVRTGELEELHHDPDHLPFMHVHEHPEATSLFPADAHSYDDEKYKWAMTIDLNGCTGCNACVVACQAENNIPVVGKDQVARGREMHWIRVDSYYEGEPENPRTVHQPVPCMHCENAPCELVCPVGATVHSDEGLNDMVYNRCVGTRYCSNNCPYKVRRFNFLQYADLETPSLKLLNNPEVTVRNRGVMEKCTYCVQRISSSRISAEKLGRSIFDGELATACQAACPAQAITFGNLNDKSSRVTKKTESPLNYALLGELNTRPRTTYLAALRNPNPALVSDVQKAAP